MNGEVGWPNSIMDDSLSEVPLLEVVSSVLLVSGMDLRSKDHLVHELSLLETLIDKKIVFLMHGSMATLAGSLEDLETSSQTI
jgi:hypothetical protein